MLLRLFPSYSIGYFTIMFFGVGLQSWIHKATIVTSFFFLTQFELYLILSLEFHDVGIFIAMEWV